MTEVTSAVTSIPVRKGRAPIKLKNGKLLSEARAEAKAAISDAKAHWRNAKDSLANAAAIVKSLVKDQGKHLKTEPTAKQYSDRNQLRDAERAFKAKSKQFTADIKAADKVLVSAGKAVEKAWAGVEKAQAAAQKVEASKPN